MGYSYESRFKKKFNLEKCWNMSVQDIGEVSGLEDEKLMEIYLKTLKETKSRSASINAVCGYCLKVLFPKETSNEDTNVAH
jgi:hypothetical protein